MSDCRPCQSVDCVPASDYTYDLQGLPPSPLPPVAPVAPPFSNDAVYYTCPSGNINFSGTLPSWITVDSTNNRLVGAAGTYRAATKTNANTEAQSAIDAFASAAITGGTLTCSSCPAPPFPKVSINDILTNAVQSPEYPGSYSIFYPFAGTTGQVLNMWMRSSVLSTFVILEDALGNDISGGGNGCGDPGEWTPNGDIANSVLQMVLPSNQTYKMEANGCVNGATGAFEFVYSCGLSASLQLAGTSGGSLFTIVYVPTTNLLFVVQTRAGGFGAVYVVNPVTNTVVNTIFINTIMNAVYGSGQDHVYLVTDDGFGNASIVEIASDGMSITNTTAIGNFVGGPSAYDSDRDHLFWVGDQFDINPAKYTIWDCATRTVVTNGTITDHLTKGTGGAVYSSATQKFYLAKDSIVGGLIKFDPVSYTQTILAQNSFGRVSIMPAKGLLAFSTGIGTVLFDINTETSVAYFAEMTNFQGATYDPCNSEIRIIAGALHGIACVDAAAYTPTNFIANANSTVYYTAFAIAFSPINYRTYIFGDDTTGDQYLKAVP